MRAYLLFLFNIILILIIIFEIGFVVLESTLRPVMQFDALANWAWKAKVLFYSPHEFFNSESELFLGGGSAHPNYPFFLPMIMAGIYYLFGNVNDVLVGLLFALQFVILIGFIYVSLRFFTLSSFKAQSPRRGRTHALMFTAVLSTIPLLSYHGFSSYADLPLTLYFTIAVIFLFKYMHAVRPRTSYLVIAGIFAGLATLIKNEGLMFAAILCIVFILYLLGSSRHKERAFTTIKRFMFFIVPFLILFLPWFIFKNIFGLGYSNVPGTFFTGFHPEVIIAFIQQVFLSNSFHIWPGIFLLILLIHFHKLIRAPYAHLFLIIIGVIGVYFIIYIFTPSYEFALDGTIIGRNMLTIIPVSIFLAGTLMQSKKSHKKLSTESD